MERHCSHATRLRVYGPERRSDVHDLRSWMTRLRPPSPGIVTSAVAFVNVVTQIAGRRRRRSTLTRVDGIALVRGLPAAACCASRLVPGLPGLPGLVGPVRGGVLRQSEAVSNSALGVNQRRAKRVELAA